MTTEPAKAAFVTFYSFKGGVGRSMALINTAALLAGRGFRVLVIDVDLEAPGLSYLNPDAPDVSVPFGATERRLQPGFVDLLNDAKLRGLEGDLFSMTALELSQRYTQVYTLPLGYGPDEGSLSIMPAGKFDGEYAQRFDSLNLRELYRQGFGEPLIRLFKKKFAEADLYDYVLVDSRTGFSDEAGICTRDLPDYLMILSGLNRQNIEGTSHFLSALRIATKGRGPNFQIILSPVPNGEDALLDDRERIAKASFRVAWGSDVIARLHIPYHPQLALTEDPHIFRRRRGYLADAYRQIEKAMLKGLGHDSRTLIARIEDTLQQKEFSVVLHDLRHLVRLTGGRFALAGFAVNLVSNNRHFSGEAVESDLRRETVALDTLLKDSVGRRIVEFLVDNLEEDGAGRKAFLGALADADLDLAERLHERIAREADDADDLIAYAIFLRLRRNDKDRAEIYFKKATELEPNAARILASYGTFLDLDRGQPEGALSYYQRAVEAEPTNSYALARYASFAERRLKDNQLAENYYTRAMDASPKNASYPGRFARFLSRALGDLNRAEIFYKMAIELDPQDGAQIGSYAVFLQKERRDDANAEIYYRRALEVSPKSVNPAANYGQFLLGNGRVDESIKWLNEAMTNCLASDIANNAEIALSLWFASNFKKESADRYEQYFKYLVQKGFDRPTWDFDQILEQAQKAFSADDYEYARKLVAVFLDQKEVEAIGQSARWSLLQPIDLREEGVLPGRAL